MAWQQRILNHLSIRKAHSRLGLDKTGVLTHPQFLAYLRRHGFQVAIASELPDILAMIRKPGCLVIAPFLQVPSYLDGKIDIQILDYPNLPIDIDCAVAKTLTPNQLMALLAYRHQTGEIQLITASAIAQELTRACRFEKMVYVEALYQKLKQAVPAAQTYADVEGSRSMNLSWLKNRFFSPAL